MVLVLYLADFTFVACGFFRFYMIMILKQNVNLSYITESLITTVASVKTSEDL